MVLLPEPESAEKGSQKVGLDLRGVPISISMGALILRTIQCIFNAAHPKFPESRNVSTPSRAEAVVQRHLHAPTVCGSSGPLRGRTIQAAAAPI